MRTFHALFLLRPSPAASEIILGVLGRAQALYGLEIQAFVFLSNHYHLICRPVDPQQLAAAMCFINSNLARELGRLYGWFERFWGRRYQVVPISDEPEAQRARLHYLLSHGCKEGLVFAPGDWPGVHCVDALLEGASLEGVWFDRTREYQARRRGIEFGAMEFATRYVVTLSPLPCWRHLSLGRQREEIAGMIRDIERAARQMHRETGRAPLGAEAIRRQDPRSGPARPKRRRAPSVHAASRAVRNAFRETFRRFVAAYRQAAARLRAGDRLALFPEYAFPPPGPVRSIAHVATPRFLGSS